jgi:hypothetical protein
MPQFPKKSIIKAISYGDKEKLEFEWPWKYQFNFKFSRHKGKRDKM